MLLTLLVSLGAMKWQRTHRHYLSITCLDVGHGQAILARLPGTMNVLFDAGSLFGSDVGTRTIVPFLDHEGISRLHAVIVSHRDIDHINGLPEVVDRRLVDGVHFDEVSFAQSQDVETIQTLLTHLANRRVPAQRVPETIDAGRAQIRVLWPTAESAARALGDWGVDFETLEAGRLTLFVLKGLKRREALDLKAVSSPVAASARRTHVAPSRTLTSTRYRPSLLNPELVW